MNTPVRAMYLTDDRDLPEDEQRTLVIFQGGNHTHGARRMDAKASSYRC